MNNTSRTSTDLNSTDIMDVPKAAPKSGGIWLFIFTLGLFLLLVKLGFWQLSRAEEKQLLLLQQESRLRANPLTIKQLLAPLSQHQGARLHVTGTLLPTPTLLLDNQVLDGQVGYLAYQLLQIPGFNHLLPVELGFVPAGTDRSVLPRLSTSSSPTNQQITLKGRLYQRQANPFVAGLGAESGEPLRIQQLDFKALSHQLGLPLLDISLQPDADLPAFNLPRRWMPVGMPPEKHLGYALQWFSLAFALLLLSVGFWITQRKQSSQQPNTSSPDSARGENHELPKA